MKSKKPAEPIDEFLINIWLLFLTDWGAIISEGAELVGEALKRNSSNSVNQVLWVYSTRIRTLHASFQCCVALFKAIIGQVPYACVRLRGHYSTVTVSAWSLKSLHIAWVHSLVKFAEIIKVIVSCRMEATKVTDEGKKKLQEDLWLHQLWERHREQVRPQLQAPLSSDAEEKLHQLSVIVMCMYHV